ncbi:MAG: alpha/beta hydrolase family protein [Candidatus Zipacnadales bacterium]
MMRLRSYVRARVLLFILAGIASGAWTAPPPEGELREYLSAVDGSRQAYGIYVPRANPPSENGYPLVMHAHGYGWHVSAAFSLWQRRWADDHGWVLVNVNGRGPNFYDGIGEDDVLRVLEDVARLVPLDRTRIFMTGASMGGTGAYRMGIRRPDIFSAVAPVDGWTDYRLWHKHWYERKDMPGSIEEFRRPLLEAVSTLYLAPTARWTNVQLYVDGEDTIVWPENAFRMQAALETERELAPDAYVHDMIYRHDLGHGGGYDLQHIYQHLLGVAGLQRPPAVSIQTTLLRYGKVHWASIDRFHLQGGFGRLDAEVRDTSVYVFTQNLDRFSLALPDSPLALYDQVQVVADGLPCYQGPPHELTFETSRDEEGKLAAWRLVSTEDPPLTKRRGLEGPIGEAFLAPFVVTWGTAGLPATVHEGQIEAEDFVREWNEFNVHYEAVRARPEDELTADDLEKNLIIFGTLESSALLKRMDAAQRLPIRVLDDRVIVRDPINGDRTYRGRKYGAYWVYPNPLTNYRTLVVGCKGRFATQPEGSVLRGLGYDLEKLQWAWSDYVIFDNDIRDLPYVENVNNKPAVLAYEAAYFVEAGFFDQDWGIDRSVELRRVLTTRPEPNRIIHIEAVNSTPNADGIEVRVVDERGQPVQYARVTLSWGPQFDCCSRPTDAQGIVVFPAPTRIEGQPLVGEVVNLCATGATYSWSDDRQRQATLTTGGARHLEVAVTPPEVAVGKGGCAAISLVILNHGTEPVEVQIAAPLEPGIMSPTKHDLAVPPAGREEARFLWNASNLPAGAYAVPLAVQAKSPGLRKTVTYATVHLTVATEVSPPVRLVNVWASDRRVGEPFEILAEIENLNTEGEVSVEAHCILMEVRRTLPSQTVRLAPATRSVVRWQSTPGSPELPRGLHTARVSLTEVPGAIREACFVVH